MFKAVRKNMKSLSYYSPVYREESLPSLSQAIHHIGNKVSMHLKRLSRRLNQPGDFPYQIVLGDKNGVYPLTIKQWAHLKNSYLVFQDLLNLPLPEEKAHRTIHFPDIEPWNFCRLFYLDVPYSTLCEALATTTMVCYFGCKILPLEATYFLQKNLEFPKDMSFEKLRFFLEFAQEVKYTPLEELCTFFLNRLFCQAIEKNDQLLIEQITVAPIKTLKLQGEAIIDDCLQHLKYFTHLTSLELVDCENVTGKGFQHLQNLTSLTSLNLLNCTGLTDKELLYFKEMTSLEILNLSHCKGLKGTGLYHLQRQTVLKTLRLQHCEQLLGSELVHLKYLTSLVTLDLSECSQWTDEELEHLPKLPSLKILLLNDCPKLTDEGLKFLEERLDIDLDNEEARLRDLFNNPWACLLHANDEANGD